MASFGSDARAAEPTSADFDNIETGDKAGKPKGKFAAHKQSIIVIASVVGVLLAYLTYRRIASGNAAGASATTTAGTTGAVAGTDTAAADTQNADALSGFATYLSNISSELTGLEATVGSQGTAIGILQNPSPTATGTPPQKTTTSSNVFQTANTGITAVIKNFTNHKDPAQAAGATAVIKDLNPNMSAAQQRHQAESVISNYQLHNSTGAYNSQIAGAQAALAKLG